MSDITFLRVLNYTRNHGGLTLIIDGNECQLNSIVGYALYHGEDPVAAVQDTLRKMAEQPYHGHKMVWINRCATVISGDRGFYEREEARLASAPRLSAGSLINFEGNTYEIVPEPNKNYGLRRIN